MEELLKLLIGRTIVGTGWIIVPPDVNREEYIQTCHAKQQVSIMTDISTTTLNNVAISQESMEFIEFPSEDELLGSQVVYIVLSNNSTPIIVGVLSKDRQSFLIGEKQFKFSKSCKGKEVTIVGDAKNGNLLIKTYSDKEESGAIYISVYNEQNKGHLQAEVQGDIVFITQTITIKCKEANINATDYIRLGVENFESAVLGDTLLNDILSPLIDVISQMKLATAMGPSGIALPETQQKLMQIKNKLNTILSEKVSLE